ncbi:MAG: acyl carrier protein [Candidatus Cloacimonetes bacterium]|jgi:acyl carrier protein|nr:acyl carrier protein [Candidatus Cloacimonadota bacterium]
MIDFLKIISETLEIDLQDLKPEDEFREYEEWDSLAHLAMISIIDEEYALVIPREEFRQMKTLADVYDYIIKHQGEEE